MSIIDLVFESLSFQSEISISLYGNLHGGF